MFDKLLIENWRQFSKLEIDFHPKLTVITGANGSGKTTVLNVLSQCIGWQPKFVSSFDEDIDGVRRYAASISKAKSDKDSLIIHKLTEQFNRPNVFGELTLIHGQVVGLFTQRPIAQTGLYTINMVPELKTRGVYIQSHRPTFPYRKMSNLPTSVATREHIYSKYNLFAKRYAMDEARFLIDGEPVSSTLLIKQDLASLATFGYGNLAVAPIPSARILFEGYCKILKDVLPQDLGFKKITVALPELIIETETGNFPLDGVSGGISSIIDITWQLFMFAEPEEPFVALIDEPENHLHPELQKSFLGNLIKAFPHVQFIVATHNPFMVSSQKDSHVYVLDYKDGKVHSNLLDHINRAGTASAILRDALGLDSTIPLWAQDVLNSTIEKYKGISISENTMNQLRADLEHAGLQDYVPDTIANLIGGDQ